MSPTQIPQTMNALVTQGKGMVSIEEKPVPAISDDEILVKVIATAQNPTDYKYIDLFGNPGTITGVDWAGIVVKLGKDVADFALGERVAGFTQGGVYEDRGAYAEYVKAAQDLAWKIPDGFSFEQAATLGCAFWTAVMGLFNPDYLGLVEPPAKIDKDEWVFIYGGSSSLGMYCIQLAHLAGYKIVTVASPRNWDMCKALGADVVLDYRDPEFIEKVKATTGDTLHRVFDTISEEKTARASIAALAPGPGRVAIVLPIPEEVMHMREDVRLIDTLIYTSLGRPIAWFGETIPVRPADRTHMAAFLRKLPGLLRTGAIQPNPIKLWPGGLAAVPDGLQYMREGKTSAEKIVYRIAEP